MKEFTSKKCGKLGKLLKESGNHGVQMKHKDSRGPNPSPSSKSEYGHVKVYAFHVNITSLLQIVYLFILRRNTWYKFINFYYDGNTWEYI